MVTVQLPGQGPGNTLSMKVTAGQDFVIDWPDQGDSGPGLYVYDRPDSDPMAQAVAYFPPGDWCGVLINPDAAS